MSSRAPSTEQARPTTNAVLEARRSQTSGGLSRRTLLRQSLGLGVGLWLTELAAGTLGFLWSAVATAAPSVTAGSLDDLAAANAGLPIREGYPAYVAAAGAFVVLVDPAIQRFLPGVDTTGDGVSLNVRALSQKCPHLGCRPNPCVEDRWFHCPCHQSRYDRLGIKARGERYGPAARSMDRYAISVDERGVLTIDTSRITLGSLPVALGEPGIIAPLVEVGCR